MLETHLKAAKEVILANKWLAAQGLFAVLSAVSEELSSLKVNGGRMSGSANPIRPSSAMLVQRQLQTGMDWQCQWRGSGSHGTRHAI